MRLLPSDPDIQTVVGRIKDNTLDLQPDFQRGAVWSKAKQRLLIDSILRDWYVPPVHLVKNDDETQEVLDGQQRLRAIFEFTQGKFTVNGKTEPFEEEIAQLDSLAYERLPEKFRRRFDRFTLRTFELVDYEPQEPYELFYRLNQPATLTAAEKRNAFFGGPREQIKELTELAEASGMSSRSIGFSNARLAYEDVIARFVWTLDAQSLGAKVTAGRITDRYRSDQKFPQEVISRAESAIRRIFSLETLSRGEVRMNKATAYSFLIVAARRASSKIKDSDLGELIANAEFARSQSSRDSDPELSSTERSLIGVFSDRATSRVNDTTSVILRDTCLWGLAADRKAIMEGGPPREFAKAAQSVESPRTLEQTLLSLAARSDWEVLA